MRSVEEVVGDLEADRLSRESELRLIDRLAGSASTHERPMLKRSLVLLSYSHLEGFCGFALSTYISVVNSLRLPCEAASAAVAAAGMADAFKALRDTNQKHALFKKSLADDGVVHMAAREQVFVEKSRQFFAKPVRIPDALIETHYSLSTDVVRKLMFQVGLDSTAIEPWRSSIDRLRSIRNSIAHGDLLKVPSDERASALLATTIEVMGMLQGQITLALNDQTYLRPTECAEA